MVYSGLCTRNGYNSSMCMCVVVSMSKHLILDICVCTAGAGHSVFLAVSKCYMCLLYWTVGVHWAVSGCVPK